MQQGQAEQAMTIMVGLRGFFRLTIMAKDHQAAFGADLDPVGIERGDGGRGQCRSENLDGQQEQRYASRHHPPGLERPGGRPVNSLSSLARHDGSRMAKAIQEVNPAGRLDWP